MKKTVYISAAALCLLAGRAWANQDQGYSLLRLYVVDGGWITWFILVPLSVITVVLVVGYLLSIRTTVLIPEMEANQLAAMLSAGQVRQAREFLAQKNSFLAEVVGAGLQHIDNGTAEAMHAVEETAEQTAIRLFRKIELLHIIGNIAPMIGLFGTVYGMIVSFQRMASATLTQRPVEVAAGGIRVALVTTFWGLLVGIPALTVYALLHNKVEALAGAVMIKAEELLGSYKKSGQTQRPFDGRE